LKLPRHPDGCSCCNRSSNCDEAAYSVR
jgi:hypothetical protein